MTGVELAAECVKNGDPAAALQRLQEAVRTRPEDPTLRTFLFQLLCVLGQWDRALNQLKVVSGLDPGALVMAQMYGEAVRCEAIRREVFEGRKSPMVFGEPEQWLAFLIESLLERGRGGTERAAAQRAQAFEEAPPSSGSINGQAFEWIADADSRLGPVLEAVINGRYYWVPFARLTRLTMDAPEDLRDLVWMPARLEFENGGEAVALLPARYPGSEGAADGLIALGRKTTWEEASAGEFHGLGQRVLSTDAGDVALLELRTLEIQAGERGDSSAPAGDD